jgi:anti-sigma regulatory factor (Ser/Thr protein kinase)
VRASKSPKDYGKQEGKPRAELLLQLHLESNPDALCLVRATVQRVTEVVHFPEPESRAVVRSVDEALANVIRHAYQGRPGQPIDLTCRRLFRDAEKKVDLGLEIVLSDAGKPVNPKKLHGRPLDEIRPGGLGLHFMKQSMDVVEFRRNHGKNLLRMVKYLDSSTPVQKPQGE